MQILYHSLIFGSVLLESFDKTQMAFFGCSAQWLDI